MCKKESLFRLVAKGSIALMLSTPSAWADEAADIRLLREAVTQRYCADNQGPAPAASTDDSYETEPMVAAYLAVGQEPRPPLPININRYFSSYMAENGQRSGTNPEFDILLPTGVYQNYRINQGVRVPIIVVMALTPFIYLYNNELIYPISPDYNKGMVLKLQPKPIASRKIYFGYENGARIGADVDVFFTPKIIDLDSFVMSTVNDTVDTSSVEVRCFNITDVDLYVSTIVNNTQYYFRGSVDLRGPRSPCVTLSAAGGATRLC
jgi:hypothetical protein